MLVLHAPVELGRSVSPAVTLTKAAAPVRSVRLVSSAVLVQLLPPPAPMGRIVTSGNHPPTNVSTVPVGTTAKQVSSSFALEVVTPAVVPPPVQPAPRDRTADQAPSLPPSAPVKPTPLSQVSPLLPAQTVLLGMPALAPLLEEGPSALQEPTPQEHRALAPSVLQDRTVAMELLPRRHAVVVCFPVLVVPQ